MWTSAALACEISPYRGPAWRVVEAQHRVATARITDTLEEQAILESLIEETKPAVPQAAAHLHFLLATPFRYAPYPHGSRFRRAHQREGAFYACEHMETALAETAFYKLLFLAEAPGMEPPRRPVEHTLFRVGCASARALDLTRPPLDRDQALWRHPTRYGPCQALADAAREADIAVLRYASVRDRHHRANIAILSPEAFTRRVPLATPQTWKLFVRADVVQAWRDFPANERYEFPFTDFAGDPRLAGLLI